MDAKAFLQLYDYHFAENRKLWDRIAHSLNDEQFSSDPNYSLGSIRDQIVHLMSVDDSWFSELRGIQPSKPVPPAGLDDRKILREYWDRVEENMRAYLAGLQDDMLFDRPIQEPEEDKDLVVWQVLLHVVNHGTDHRAQILRSLNNLGVKTTSQDFIFHVYDQLDKD